MTIVAPPVVSNECLIQVSIVFFVYMRTLLAALLLFATAAFAKVEDHADIIDNIGLVERQITNTPVWIETWAVSPGPIKTYADNRVKELTNEGFLIVITTQPRAWRISMNPVGLVDGDATLPIGEEMAGYFKRGNFEGGIAQAAERLGKLVQVSTPPPAVEAPKPVSRPKRKAQESSTPGIVWLIIGSTAVAVGSVVCILIYRRKKEIHAQRLTEMRAAQELRQKRDEERYEREQRERLAEETRKANERFHNPPSFPNGPKGPQGANGPVGYSIGPTKRKTVKQRQAEEYWNSFDDADRRRIARKYSSHNGYSEDIFSDPLRFYMFMTLMNSSAAGPSVSERVNPPTSSYTPPSRKRDDDDDDSRRRSSSSDSSSSSSSSWDSGGSSGGYDSSSSSSDSSGSGGSW